MKAKRHITVPKWTIALLACATTSLQAAPLIIDNFNEDLPETTFDTAFVTGSMLGGEADYDQWVSAAAYSISGGTLHSEVDESRLDIDYDGEDASSGVNFDLGDVDLTAGGAHDSIQIDVSSVSGTVDVEVTFWTGAVSGTSVLLIEGASAGTLEFPFADFVPVGTPADPASVSAVRVSTGALAAPTTGEIHITQIRVGDPPAPAVTTDTARPGIKILNKKKYKTPRRRHRIKGLASDNVAVQKVEARVPGKKGWKKAKLRSNGRFLFRTPKLEKKTTRIKIRAIDTSNNRSKVQKVRAKAKL